jgi:hypothetical protein
MTKASPRIAAAVLLGFATLPLLLTPAGAERVSDRARQIGMKFKCMCGMCSMTAGGCSHPGGEFAGPCQAWALPALLEIDDLLRQGKTDEQIVEVFVQKYGTGVYAEPPKSGFSLVAWAMPTVYLVVGAVVVVFVISRWRKRPATEPGSAGSAKAEISPELLERARAQAARETED